MRGCLLVATASATALNPSYVGWAVAGASLVVAFLVYLRARRERRRNRELIDRLDEVEARLGALQPVTGQAELDRPGPVAEWLVATPSGDVLAGRTTDVQRIVNGPAAATRSLAEQAILSVHGHLDGGLTPHDLARVLRVSLRTLERGLAMCLDCTPRQLILAMRMREARRMLGSGEFLVKEVAYKLGFADPYHFSRCFKAFYHVAPSGARPAERSP